MTFYEYLKLLGKVNLRNPRGDFVMDALADDTWPKGVTRWEDVWAHLNGWDACIAAREGAYRVWTSYLDLMEEGR